MIDVSIDRQIAAARDELGMRRHVYPRFIAAGSMTPEKAERRLAEMAAILATLERLRDERRPELF